MIGILNRRRGERGFTLIEILLALIVLMVGLVGIMALFPVGIKSTKESTEDTMAALIAESVYQAIVRGMRSPTAVNGTSITFNVHHDGLPNGVAQVTVNDVANWAQPNGVIYPAAGSAYKLGSNPSASDKIKTSLDDITNTAVPVSQIKDPSESYRQYSFQFDVKRVLNDPAPLFEFQIRVFRNFPNNIPPGAPGTATPRDYPVGKHVFSGQVAGN
ncbi:MAG: prepilin-type N-terminal cleavage/methylation domain-containing protein [Planctomycetes bacterium]|nr:prepilin-type N-terminal cleavage/methylation domain-containing protein [Planctomycetota bacterium]